MRPARARDFYIPAGSEKIEDNQSDAVVYVYGNEPDQPAVIAFHGRAQKPDWRYFFRTEEPRDQRIRAVFERRRSYARRRAQTTGIRKTPHDFRLGAILYSTWGWEQTNVDFFQVVRVVSDRAIELREIACEKEGGGQWATGTAIPSIDDFVGEPFPRRVNRGSVTIDNVRPAWRWHGRPVYWTAYA